MKFTIDREVFEEATAWVARTLPARPAIPVLSGVRILAGKGTVELSSFDYEVSSKTEVEAQVELEGEVLVSGKMIANISKQLPKQTVNCEAIEGKLQITCGSSKFELLTMPLEDYPALPKLPESLGTVSTSLFSRAVSQVAMASSRDDALPLLSTVNLQFKGEQLLMMATDRYRLAMCSLPWAPKDAAIDSRALVKAKIISDMAKSLPSGSQIEIALNDPGSTGAIFGIEALGRIMTSQITDGDYPPVATLFPTESPIQASLNKEDLVQALRRVSVVAEHGTVVRLNFTSGSLRMEAGEGDDAKAQEEIPCNLQGEEELQASFNPRYLLEGVQALEGDTVNMAFTHPAKPVVISGENKNSSEEFKYLLMPIR